MPRLLDWTYLAIAAGASPWILWRRWQRGRWPAALRTRWRGETPPRPHAGPLVWLHGVSVGEVNLLQCLVERLEQQRSDVQCVVSTSTPSGYDLAQRIYAPRPVFYCPLDFSWSVQRALQTLQPDLLVLAELELWPHLIGMARRAGARVAVVNGRLSLRSYYGYRRLGWLTRRMLQSLDLVAAQDEVYARRFRDAGALPAIVEVTGSMKFDGAQTRRNNPRTQECRAMIRWSTSDTVWLAGSTQADDEQAVLSAFVRLAPHHPRLRLIITPRHQERFDEAARMIERTGWPWRRRSQLKAGAAADCSSDPARILLVDAIGELAAWWGLADIAYVGGSMGARGGQNMIEPAAYGAAVCFGPQTQNFRAVTELLLEAKAAVVVHDADELAAFVEDCLRHPQEAFQLGARARLLVLQQQGAADRTAQRLLELLPPVHASPVLSPAPHWRQAS